MIRIESASNVSMTVRGATTRVPGDVNSLSCHCPSMGGWIPSRRSTNRISEKITCYLHTMADE